MLEEVIEAGLVRRTDETITDPDLLMMELEKIRQRGFAFDNMENEDHVKCVAAPIYNSRGRVIAAVSISGPSFRMDDERMEFGTWSPGCRSWGGNSSRELGYLG